MFNHSLFWDKDLTVSSLDLTLSSMRQLVPLAFQLTSTVAPELSARLACELFLRPRRLPLNKRESAMMKASQTETLQSGRKVYFWGDNQNQPLIGLIHGWESRGTAFHRWIPLFLESGFRVMGWDGPAHGFSPGRRTSAPDFAKAFVEDLNELNLPLYGVVGHSLGGVVVGLLNRHITLPPKSVIIAAPSRLEGVFDRYYNHIRLSTPARRRFENILQSKTGLNMEEASLIRSNISTESQVLVIHDIHDREVPFSDFQELQNHWKSARFVATHGLGHRRILRDISIGHEIVDFFSDKKS